MCSDVFNRHKPDVVLHFAAEARIQNCIEDPQKAFEVNSLGTLNMLALCKKYSVKKLILSSTSAIYGNSSQQQTENAKPDCLNPYSLSKLHAEDSCRLYSKLYGVETICLRYFNVYGPRNPSKGQYAPVIGIFKRQKSLSISLYFGTKFSLWRSIEQYFTKNWVYRRYTYATNYGCGNPL
jgi:UDP-glucose 4-epimerase